MGMYLWDSKMIYFMNQAAEKTEYYKELASCIAPHITKDSVLCDVGCGLGYLAIELSKYCKKVYAVDISGEVIEELRKKLKKEGIANVEALTTDVFTWKPEEDIDATIYCMFGSLEEIDQIGRQLHVKQQFIVRRLSRQHKFKIKEKEQRAHRHSAQAMAEELDQKGIRYEYCELTACLDQPFRNLEEAVTFFEIYNKTPERVTLDEVKERVVKNDDEEYPYLFPAEKRMGLIQINMKNHNAKEGNKMKKIFLKMSEELKQNRDVVLCSILASSGSSPRGEGAKMAVFADGTTMGTVGGGAVELRATEIAKEALREKKSLVKGYCLTKNDVEDIGMICGGNVTIYIQFFSGESPEHLAWVEEVYRLLTEGEEGWIINRITDGAIVDAGIYCESKGLQFGGGLTEEMYAGKLKRNPVMVKGEPLFYIEPIHRPRKVWIFGGGHVGKALVPVLTAIDFDVVVYDNRPDYAKKEMFPLAADVVCGDFCKINDYITIDEKDYVVIMTPGHQSDYELLEQVLYTDATYIGCIGSRHKVAATTERLLKAGHTMENIKRIHSPIGIEIKAETPEEIAISIAAQLIEHRASVE